MTTQSFGVWLRDSPHQCKHLYGLRDQVIRSCRLRDVEQKQITRPDHLFSKLDYLEGTTVRDDLFSYASFKWKRKQESMVVNQLTLFDLNCYG